MEQQELSEEEKCLQRLIYYILGLDYDPSHTILWALDPGYTNMFTAVNGYGTDSCEIKKMTSKEFHHKAGHHRMTHERYFSLLKYRVLILL